MEKGNFTLEAFEMTIDSHQHFWQYDPNRHSWIGEDMSVLKRDFLPEDLLSELKLSEIEGSIAVQADQSLSETRFLLDLSVQQDFIKAVVGWVDLRSDDLGNHLDRYSDTKKLAGFRHVVQDEPDVNFMLQPDFQRGIDALAAYDFTYDILIFPPQLPAAIELVKKFPTQPFVVDHIAKPYIKAGAIDFWKKSITALSKHDNVWCKISGLVTEADWDQWKYEDMVPYLDVVFDQFGTNKVMFGSDWPVCLLGGTYSSIKQIIDRYIEGFSDSEKESIMGLNAMEFYKISE